MFVVKQIKDQTINHNNNKNRDVWDTVRTQSSLDALKLMPLVGEVLPVAGWPAQQHGSGVLLRGDEAQFCVKGILKVLQVLESPAPQAFFDLCLQPKIIGC